MGLRSTFTDRRRALLARRVEVLESREPRSLITESLGILTVGIGLPAVADASQVKIRSVSLPVI